MSKEIAETIMFQIKTLDKWALAAFGAKNFRAMGGDKYRAAAQFKGLCGGYLGGLCFKVNGITFKGDIMITLNGSDLYDIQAYSNKGVLKCCLSDVYAEDLVYFLDRLIEKGSTQDELQGAVA